MRSYLFITKHFKNLYCHQKAGVRTTLSLAVAYLSEKLSIRKAVICFRVEPTKSGETIINTTVDESTYYLLISIANLSKCEFWYCKLNQTRRPLIPQNRCFLTNLGY